MNFFEQQEQARSQSRRLIWLFALAVATIVVAVDFIFILAVNVFVPMQASVGYLNGGPVVYRLVAGVPVSWLVRVTLGTLAIIFGGALYQMWNLRQGGHAVARMAGGRLLSMHSNNPDERRFLNVVEEMALASGVAMPLLYVLDDEPSINAFAAGYGPNDAVVAVTRGALTRLSRDELQGVVAHEFSHIFNGDMRLNLRLIGLLSGILLIAQIGSRLSRTIEHAPSKTGMKAGGVIALTFGAGLVLWLVGSIGVVFGRLIKSAVSRQREFLADASAVQFTRNADGLGGALRKIGGLGTMNHPGSEILNPAAEALSHLFLGAAKPSLISGWWATHPSIEERIRRIYGRSMPMLSAPEPPAAQQADRPVENLQPIAFEPVDWSSVGAIGAAFDASHQAAMAMAMPPASPPSMIPVDLLAAVRQPETASALILALLLADDAAQAAQQLVAIESAAPTIDRSSITRLAASLRQASPFLRLPLLDLTMPALKTLALTERDALLRAVDQAIVADQRITLTEFVIQTILTRRLMPRSHAVLPVRFASLAAAREPFALLLSLAAPLCGQDPQAAFDRGQASAAFVGLVRQPAESVRFDQVNAALDALNTLAPLQKPLVFKALAQALCSPDRAELPPRAHDFLRAISAALDLPMPGARLIAQASNPAPRA